jgi:ABC-type branched-subunit amino acid transport system ATPase component
MSIDEGAIHGLIGPNGSGKSTTMNLISGALAPTDGAIRFENVSLNGMPVHRIARLGVIRTFQLTRVYAEGSVRDAVRIATIAKRGSPWDPRRWWSLGDDASSFEKADAAIEKLGLADFIMKPAGTLPSGLKRKLSMAMALAAEPRLLLLDEPLAGLNATEKSDVADRIEKLREDGMTILLVEHDIRSVMRLCDRVTVINFGKMIATGTPAEISGNDAVIKAYLGHRRHANVGG